MFYESCLTQINHLLAAVPTNQKFLYHDGLRYYISSLGLRRSC